MFPIIFPFLVQMLVSVALQAVAYLIMPRPKQSTPNTVKDFDKPTVEMREIPVVFGEVWVTPQLLMFTKKATNTYKAAS